MESRMQRHRLVLPPLAFLAACSGGTATNNGTAAAPAPPVNQAASAAPAAPAIPTPAADAWLPSPGRHAARAMALAPPAEAVALRARMVAAIGRNQAWFQTYAAQHAGGPLPWHINLGISEAEYARFLALTRRIGLRESGRVTLVVTRRSDGGLALMADGAGAPLNGMILYPARGRVETPLGGLTTRRTAGNDAADSPLGRWQGAEWSNRGSGAARPLSLVVGRRASGEMLLYYSFGPSDAESVILFYPAEAAQ